jgi:hypothetical protein
MEGDMTANTKNQVLETMMERDPMQPDWYLQSLVSIVNGNNGEFPVTLYVKGLMISGNLVSGHKYFAGLRAQLTQFFGGESEKIRETVAYLTEPGESFLDETNEFKDFPQYVHLRGAMTLTPGQKAIPSGEGGWWRGRLANVDGFHFGLFSSK